MEVLEQEFAKGIPLRRWAKLENIGQAVWFLASRAADYIAGQII